MKLPDINFRRGAPELASPQAAALPNKLRALNAAQQGTRNVISTIDRAVENEARLNATQRLNAARRDYQAGLSELAKDYHVNTDKSPESMTGEIEALRSKVYGEARKSVSGRAAGYLNQGLDSFRTQVQASELRLVQDVTESRTKLHLSEQLQDSLLMANGDNAGMLLDDYNASVENSGLPAADRNRLLAEGGERYIKTVTNKLLENNETAAAYELTQTEAFKQLDPDVQTDVRIAIRDTTLAATKQAVDAYAAAGVRGQVSPEQVMDMVEGTVGALHAVNDSEANEAIVAAQSEALFNVFTGMINRGDVDGVEKRLASGKFDAVLGAEQTARLLRSTSAARSSGLVGDVWGRAALTADLNRTIRILEDSSVPLNPNIIEDTKQAIADYRATFPSSEDFAGSATAANLITKVNDALADAQVRTQAAYDLGMSPAEAQLDPFNDDPDTIYRKNLRGQGFADRAALMKENTPAFARIALGEPPDPMPGDDAGIETITDWLKGRAALVNRLSEVAQTDDFGGPLEPAEVQEFNRILYSLAGDNFTFGDDNQQVGGLSAFLGALGEALPSNSDRAMLFKQLQLDDAAGVMPVAVEMAVNGDYALADKMLIGSRLNVTIGGSEMGLLEETFAAQLGAALEDHAFALDGGGSMQLYDAYKEAALAVYKYERNQSGVDREGEVPDTGLMEDIIDSMFGGVITIGEHDFVMPDPATEPYQLEEWFTRQDSSTIGDVYDGQNNKIPPEEFDTLWFAANRGRPRFYPVPSDTPGVYYIRDTDGSPAQEGMLYGNVPGSLLTNGKGGFATIRYNASNVSEKPRPRFPEGSRIGQAID